MLPHGGIVLTWQQHSVLGGTSRSSFTGVSCLGEFGYGFRAAAMNARSAI
jgi:hypothetical protein